MGLWSRKDLSISDHFPWQEEHGHTSRATGSINSLQSPTPDAYLRARPRSGDLSVLLFDNKIVYIEVSLTVSKMRSNILRHISHTRYHSAAMPLLSLHHRCTLSSCGNMKGCTLVSFMEEKLSIFRNILTFFVDAALLRCLRRDRGAISRSLVGVYKRKYSH